MNSRPPTHLNKRVGQYYLGRTIGEVRRNSCCGAPAANENNKAITRPHRRRGREWGQPDCVAEAAGPALHLPLAPPPSHDDRHLITEPQGTYAKVKYGQHVETGEAVAVKVRLQLQSAHACCS